MAKVVTIRNGPGFLVLASRFLSRLRPVVGVPFRTREPRERTHMSSDKPLVSERFPRSSKYHPEWVLASVSGGANSLWLTEWLASALDLRPGMRVLDLGCGRASSSIFLRREFGVQVWATDLWFSASENMQRIRDAGVEDGVFPIHADARSLPFAAEFFDAIVCIDSPLVLRDGRPVPELPGAVCEAGRPGGNCGRWARAGNRRSPSRSSSRVVDPGFLVPAFGSLVAPALGTDGHHGH